MQLLRLVLVSICIVMIAGCLPANNRDSATRVFQLEVEDIALPRYPASDRILQIARPTAQAGYDSRGIVYSRTSYQLNRYRNSHWVDTPSRMLQPALAAAFERAGLFRAVLQSSATSNYDYRLDTEIIQLRQIFADAGPSTVNLDLRLQLFERGSGDVLATRVIKTAAPSPSEDATGAVRAANQALRQALQEAVGFVAETQGATPLEESE